MNAIEEHVEPEGYLFEANKVIFQVRDLRANEPQTFNKRAIDALGFFLRPSGNDSPPKSPDRSWRYRLKLPTPNDLRVITFSSPPQAQGSEGFSLIPLMLEGHAEGDLEPDDVLRLLHNAYTDLGGDFIKSGGQEGGETKGNEFQLIDLDHGASGVGLISISPNWLGGTLSHGKPTGGPGSFPASKPVPTGAQHKFKLKGTGTLDSLLRFRRPGAQVVILDTARSLNEFPTPNIFTANPSMEVIPYPDQKELNALVPYWTPDDHYDMCDHGTFIASIIREITPSTKIYLYQVLNCYGDGTFISVSHGLAEALNRHGNDNTDIVFNCSFGMVHELPTRKEFQDLFPNLWEWSTQELIFMSMRETFERVTALPNVLVVASAGNDAKDGEARPYARYPAGFHNVLSVAALAKGHPRNNDEVDTANYRKYKLASYSNSPHSSDPTKDQAYSFATFGGERLNQPPHSLSPSGGVRGVYIGIIPRERPGETFSQDGPANPTRVVEWSGTSFAAPIISALIAAQDDELERDNPNIPRPYETEDGANVILLRQGP